MALIKQLLHFFSNVQIAQALFWQWVSWTPTNNVRESNSNAWDPSCVWWNPTLIGGVVFLPHCSKSCEKHLQHTIATCITLCIQYLTAHYFNTFNHFRAQLYK